jgi:hypothetical protein
MQCGDAQVGIAKRIADALRRDGILMVAGIPTSTQPVP